MTDSFSVTDPQTSSHRQSAPALLHRPAGPTHYSAHHGSTMGTTWSAKFFNSNGHVPEPKLVAEINSVLADITRQMSTWDDNSTISRLNRAAPGWYQLPDEFFHVLAHALELARSTQGAYDPTLGKLVDLWGFGIEGMVSRPPREQDITVALAQGGWHRTSLNVQHQAVWQPGGMQFDLSSIAKGYGVDQIAAVLDRHGIDHYLVEVGGELKCRGRNPEDAPWTVDIEAPAPGMSDSPLPIYLADCAIATSGDYRRYFEYGGTRYAHTLNPHSGTPLAHNLASVSVLHTDCILADGMATALLSLGPERGPDYARAHGIAALFMCRHGDDLALEWTPGFNAALPVASP